MSTRQIYRILIGILALHLVLSLVAWPQLPERVPIHFGFGGQPTRWVRTDVVSWFGIWILGAATLWLVHGLTRLAERSPELWNVPNKKLFLALSPEARALVVMRLQRQLAWVMVLVALCFGGVQLAVYLTATDRSAGLNGAAAFLTLGPILGVLVLAVFSSIRMGPWIQELWQVEQQAPRE